MKTSDSIEAQEERKKARGEPEKKGEKGPFSVGESTGPVTESRRRSLANLKTPWQPGYCPNPGGRPKHDLASEIARACFEKNAEALFKAYSKSLLRGNAYAFKELADRGYGKLRETHAIEEVRPYSDLTTEQLEERLREGILKMRKIEQELGMTLPPEGSKPI